MIAFEALADRLAHQIVGGLNIRIEQDGRKVIFEVPAAYVGGLRGLIRHETYGFEIRPPADGKVTTEEHIAVGTRQTPMHESRRILKQDEQGRSVRFVVATLKEKKHTLWL